MAGTTGTLTGANIANNWDITGLNSGALNLTTTFSGFNNITGGTNTDSFTLGASGSISGAINGGGAGGANTLIGRNADNSWAITGPNTGTLGETAAAPALYVANFSNIQNLVGGTGTDTFTFNNGSSLTGSLNGGLGTDTINLAALATVSVTLGATGFSNIEQITGNNTASTLTGDNTINTWTLTGQNDGTVNGITFVDFNNLVGGNNTDTFTFNNGSSLTGSLNGGAGTDSVNMSALTTVNVTLGATGFSNIEQITGNNTASTLRGDTANTWTINSQNDGTVNGIAFVDFNNLTGGTGLDTFTFNPGGNLTGILDGGTGAAGIIDHVNQSALATVDVTLGLAGPYRNIEQFTGNNTASTLRSEAANTWAITGQNDGTVNDIAFDNFNNLTGGTNTDTFNISTAGQLTGLINGGSGAGANTLNMSSSTANTLVRLLDAAPAATVNNPAGTLTVFQVSALNGNSNANHTLALDVSSPLTASTWNINAVNSGTVNFGPIASFTGFRNLTGSALNDTFTLTSGSVQELVTGLIDGGGQAVGGEDVLILTNMTGGAAGVAVRLGTAPTAGQLNVHGIERIQGNNASTLIADNGTNDWRITGANDGTVRLNVGTTDDLVAFNDFSVLRGGDGNDNFQILTNTALTASIAGGGQIANTPGDTIDYSAQATVTVNFGPDAFNGITQIESVRGNGTDSTLNGPTSGNANWTVTGLNTGSVADGSATMGFEGFNYLAGGSGDDTFTVAGGSLRNVATGLTGLIQGGGGTNTLSVLLTGPETGQVNYLGSTGTDNIVITGTAGTYNGAYTPGAAPADYDRLAYTSATNVTFTVGYRDVDTVQTDRTLATLTVNGSANTETITLGTGTFAVGTRTPVNYANVANVTVNGQAGSDTVNLNNFSIGGTLRLTAETVTGNGLLTANTLILDNVGQFGASGALIQTNLDTLQLINTGLVYINEDNGLNLNTTGAVTNSGVFNIAGTTNINAGGGSLTLDNALNDFDTVIVSNAASINLRDSNSIGSGSITADEITLRTATGIGSGPDVFTPVSLLSTSASSLNVLNDNGDVFIANSRPVSASVITQGNIHFTNEGTLTIRQLNANGGRQTDTGTLGGNIYLSVNNGSAYGNPATNLLLIPDIVAQNFYGFFYGSPRDIGQSARYMSVMVRNDFTVFADNAYIHYFGLDPTNPNINAIFFEYVGLEGFTKQLLEIESLSEFDPAIFSAVRNYYYEDVAIMMPADQRLDGVDEEEEGKEKAKTSDGKAGCEGPVSASGTDRDRGANACDGQAERKERS